MVGRIHAHESEYRGPFRISGIFPLTYHQGSVQYKNDNGGLLVNENLCEVLEYGHGGLVISFLSFCFSFVMIFGYLILLAIFWIRW